MTSVPAPTTTAALAKPKRIRMGLVVVLSLAVVGAGAVLTKPWYAPSAVQAIGEFHSIQPMDLDVKVVKDGELAAIHNIDINCEVEGQSTIQTIVKEGSYVTKGDVLVTLDSSQIKQRIEDTTLDVEKATADVTNAREMREIQVSKNSADLEAAEVSVRLAKLELQQYTDGTYPQDLKNAQTAVEMARITLKNREEEYQQTLSLNVKGFVTAADVKKDQLAMVEATNALRKSETALRVLEKYTHEMNLAEYENDLAQAEKRLQRTKRENASALTQRDSELQAREQILAAAKRRLEKYQEQFAACTITAPADGLVVYGSSQDRWSNTQIQEGAQVRERQMLIRLPDTSQMKAVVRVQEAQVSRLSVGQRALVRIVGMNRPVPATLTKISVLSDSSQRWWNPDLKEYPVELTLDQTPPNLKPAIGVTAEIFVDRLRDVLAAPLAAVYSVGNDAFVFVRSGSTARPAKVTLGSTNETHAEIKEGLKPGTEVLLLQAGQGRKLLEDAGVKIQPATRNADAEALKEKAPPQIPGGPPVPGAPQAAPGAEGAQAPASPDGAKAVEQRPSGQGGGDREGNRSGRRRGGSGGGGGGAGGGGEQGGPR